MECLAREKNQLYSRIVNIVESFRNFAFKKVATHPQCANLYFANHLQGEQTVFGHFKYCIQNRKEIVGSPGRLEFCLEIHCGIPQYVNSLMKKCIEIL